MNFSNSSTFSFSRLSLIFSWIFSFSDRSISLIFSISSTEFALLEIEFLSQVNCRIDVPIRLDDDVGAIRRTEYVKNPTDPDFLLIYNDRIDPRKLCIFSAQRLCAHNQLLLN
jgi:hypothetical protein